MPPILAPDVRKSATLKQDPFALAAALLWIYDQVEVPYRTIHTDTPPVSSSRTIYVVRKSVEIRTADSREDLLWKTETQGFPRIAGTAIKRLKKRMERMQKVLASTPHP